MNRTRNKRAGLTLVESMVSVVIVSVMMVSAVNTVGASRTTMAKAGDDGIGMMLAQDMMAEILQKEYSEPVDAPLFGREAGELAGLRANYDDVDDYDAWNETPPKMSDGTAIPDRTGWRRKVKIEFVDPASPNTVVVSDLGLKRIVVTIKDGANVVAKLRSLRLGTAVRKSSIRSLQFREVKSGGLP